MAVPKTTETWCRDGSVQVRQFLKRLHEQSHPYIFVYTWSSSVSLAMRLLGTSMNYTRTKDGLGGEPWVWKSSGEGRWRVWGTICWSHDHDDVRTSLPHLDKSNGCTCISGCTLLLAMYNVNWLQEPSLHQCCIAAMNGAMCSQTGWNKALVGLRECTSLLHEFLWYTPSHSECSTWSK